MDPGVVVTILVVGVVIYFLPVIIAISRGHHNTLAIVFLNLFVGWTGIGWLAALVWAGTAVERTRSPPLRIASATAKLRVCPQCGEEIKRIARVCKHCKSPVSPIYVEDSEANRQLLLIGELARKGLSPEQVVQELSSRGERCLVPNQDWNASLVNDLINDFRLAKI
jgi:ribosomal protein L32